MLSQRRPAMHILRNSGLPEPELSREDEQVSSPREARGAAGRGAQSKVEAPRKPVQASA